MEEKDLHYLGVLGTRKRQVAQLDITVEAASDDADDQANADLVRDWLDRDTLQDDLFDIMDAVGKGVSATEIVWETSENQWWPGRLELVLPQWLMFDRVDGKELLLRDGSGDGQPLDPFKYIVHQVKAKSGLPIRGGLARPVPGRGCSRTSR
jgi:phage gp29-like protein